MHGTQMQRPKIKIHDALSSRIKHGLLIAVPLLLLVNGVIWSLYAMNAENQRKQWQLQATLTLDSVLVTIDRLRKDLFGDLRLLADSPYLKQTVEEATESNLLSLASQWEVFSAVKRHYDQIRWIDETGMERLRVDLTSNGAKRLNDDQLQDKSDRYYVRAALTYPIGQIYASPIDLNQEHGALEHPYKPMLRLVMPLANSQGERRGLLTLNVRAEEILDDLERHAHVSQGRLLLIDHVGYYLHGFNKDQAWGNVLEKGDDAYHRFDRFYPAAWREMVRKGAGQIADETGLFAYRTFKYGKGGFENRYFLVMALLPEELAAETSEMMKSCWTISLLVSILLTFMAFYTALRCHPRQTD